MKQEIPGLKNIFRGAMTYLALHVTKKGLSNADTELVPLERVFFAVLTFKFFVLFTDLTLGGYKD